MKSGIHSCVLPVCESFTQSSDFFTNLEESVMTVHLKSNRPSSLIQFLNFEEMKLTKITQYAVLTISVTVLSVTAFGNTYVFTGKGSWSDASNWQGGKIAPRNLEQGDTILITGNAVTTAECCDNDFESNNGTVIISAGASLTLQSATQFVNDKGSIIVNGTLINNTNLEVYSTSSITVSGSFVNQLWIGNQGTVTLTGGTLTNSSKLDNNMDGKKGEIIANCGSTITNTSAASFNVGNTTLFCKTKITNSGSMVGSAVSK